ncbi:acetyltransferase, GNAT family [Brevibacterium mcbrellneri ATCC 49030]|uniref:Acetyltransferase, GNAT family n=1 Tax=Brevibacterium mcbrellneri ATCC 49030 TaxID=585530 RepID=D4YPC5_9MICO|nr:GNAT family N-acetyltransferase [Brevibacterium mcbrellneri]EFG46937.1 acetyltransferase, GNAT family [Brevibacterium mcbrellneri ATCC 49030]
MMAPVFRQFGPEETSLLQRATLGNMNWCGERFMMDDILARPEFSHYVTIRPERGDFGVVAEVEGNPIGVCWAQFLPADDPGYGFIDEQTPEASLWVSSGARGQGVGRRLLQALVSEAKVRGLRRISLSVEPDNFAKQLYRSLGFEDVGGREDDGVMLLLV